MARVYLRVPSMRLRYEEKYKRKRDGDGARVAYGSYTLTLPKALVEALGWKDGDEIVPELKGTNITLRRQDQ